MSLAFNRASNSVYEAEIELTIAWDKNLKTPIADQRRKSLMTDGRAAVVSSYIRPRILFNWFKETLCFGLEQPDQGQGQR